MYMCTYTYIIKMYIPYTSMVLNYLESRYNSKFQNCRRNMFQVAQVGICVSLSLYCLNLKYFRVCLK